MCEKRAYRGRPAPGSKEARELGCTCPPCYNSPGYGSLTHGKGKYIYALDCPIHSIHSKDSEGDVV